jgi:hypothetical protein
MGNLPFMLLSRIWIHIITRIPIVYYGQEQSLDGTADPVRLCFSPRNIGLNDI